MGLVGLERQRPEERHDCVTEEFINEAAIPNNRLCRQPEELVQHLNDDPRRRMLCVVSVTTDVHEKDRYLTTRRFEPGSAGALKDHLRDLGADIPPEGVLQQLLAP